MIDSLKDSAKSLGEATQEASANIGKTISSGTSQASEYANKIKNEIVDKAPAIGDAAQSGINKTLSYLGNGFKQIGNTFSGWMKSILNAPKIDPHTPINL